MMWIIQKHMIFRQSNTEAPPLIAPLDLLYDVTVAKANREQKLQQIYI